MSYKEESVGGRLYDGCDPSSSAYRQKPFRYAYKPTDSQDNPFEFEREQNGKTLRSSLGDQNRQSTIELR